MINFLKNYWSYLQNSAKSGWSAFIGALVMTISIALAIEFTWILPLFTGIIYGFIQNWKEKPATKWVNNTVTFLLGSLIMQLILWLL